MVFTVRECKDDDREWGLILARPVNTEYRSAILGAFDRHTIRSIKEINNHLKLTGEFKSYHSTRRILVSLCKEGLLSELPSRADKNAIQYTKLVFNTSVVLVTYDKDLVDVGQYVHRLVNEQFPEAISPQASVAIKSWILDALASSYPNGYEGKRDIPDPDELKKRLETTLEMLKRMHVFIRDFLESGAFSPVARAHMAEDFAKQYAELHTAIVEKTWHD
jgi:hypothetical protein